MLLAACGRCRHRDVRRCARRFASSRLATGAAHEASRARDLMEDCTMRTTRDRMAIALDMPDLGGRATGEGDRPGSGSPGRARLYSAAGPEAVAASVPRPAGVRRPQVARHSYDRRARAGDGPPGCDVPELPRRGGVDMLRGRGLTEGARRRAHATGAHRSDSAHGDPGASAFDARLDAAITSDAAVSCAAAESWRVPRCAGTSSPSSRACASPTGAARPGAWVPPRPSRAGADVLVVGRAVTAAPTRRPRRGGPRRGCGGVRAGGAGQHVRSKRM
jgi:hypothetical protein